MFTSRRVVGFLGNALKFPVALGSALALWVALFHQNHIWSPFFWYGIINCRVEIRRGEIIAHDRVAGLQDMSQMRTHVKHGVRLAKCIGMKRRYLCIRSHKFMHDLSVGSVCHCSERLNIEHKEFDHFRDGAECREWLTPIFFSRQISHLECDRVNEFDHIADAEG